MVNWPLSRLILSKGASYYVRLITGLPVTDPTGGFKCFRRRLLEAIPLDAVRSNGYAFQVEMTYLSERLGLRIHELPIYFEDRRIGKSKMTIPVKAEAAWRVFQVWWRHHDIPRIE